MVGPYADEEITAIEEVNLKSTTTISALQIAPNPFNARTKFSFSIQRPQNISLDVYDMNGRHISSLANRQYPAGQHELVWNAANFSSGMYLYRFEQGIHRIHGRLLLIK